MKKIRRLFLIILGSWLILSFSSTIFLNYKKVSPKFRHNSHYDFYYLNNTIVTGSILGSAGYVDLCFYDKKDESIIIELHNNLSDDDDIYLKLTGYSIFDATSYTINDGTYFIADIDFDSAYEVVEYSMFDYEVGKNIYQITSNDKVVKENSSLSLAIINIVCFFNNILSYLVTVLIILIIIGMFVYYLLKRGFNK